MSIFTIGRVCKKTKGRDAPATCIIVDVVDKNYVLITGPEEVTGVRRRKVNISHLEPISKIIDISKDAKDSDIAPLIETYLKEIESNQ